ncbi:MAG: DNA-3-methyladenine glycosylase I, partial [Pseudomonadales bacterium]
GLSWLTILARRDTYRAAFDNFDVHKVAAYDDAKQQTLLADPGIIRNKLKIAATVQNAKTFIAIQNAFGSFDAYIWQFVENKPVINHWKTMGDVPVSTELSDRISKDLKKRGMKFVGTTIIYSFLQATGLVMDHTVECYRYHDLVK